MEKRLPSQHLINIHMQKQKNISLFKEWKQCRVIYNSWSEGFGVELRGYCFSKPQTIFYLCVALFYCEPYNVKHVWFMLFIHIACFILKFSSKKNTLQITSTFNALLCICLYSVNSRQKKNIFL